MTTDNIPVYDVVQIGYGPVSEIMALALARQGRKVCVFERWRERFALPRAVCIDHELYRVLGALGMSRALPAVSHAGPMYRWFNADWKELLAIDWESESISGGPEVNFVHQPTLEKMFEDVVQSCPTVELNLGWEAIEATQTADYAQWCNPARPTTIVPAGVKDGRYFRRWEFMRLPGETRDDLEHEHVAWELLAPWVRPDQARIVRHKVYTFRSLLADTWRKGRMLIAGDAAHVMPPFMGQGLCAGLRDDWNLAWKLDLVLDGRADERLLDSYQPERRPHVSDVIDLSMYLGKMICIPDAAKAAERDEAFFSGKAPPPPAFPSLTDGILRRDASGAVQAPAGLLSPHGRVRAGRVEGRFDEVAGLGFVLITRSAAALAALGEAQLGFLDALGARCVRVAAAGSEADGPAMLDLDGKFIPYMERLGIETMLVRPDFYLYGAVARPGDVNALVDDLCADLQRHGLKPASRHEPEVSFA